MIIHYTNSLSLSLTLTVVSSLLKRFCTEAAGPLWSLYKKMASTRLGEDLCSCGQDTDDVSHCHWLVPLMKLDCGLSRLHSTNDDVVQWLDQTLKGEPGK